MRRICIALLFLAAPALLGDTKPPATVACCRPISATFSQLGTPSDGTVRYCSDCTQASPCAGSGTGALATRINGTWSCTAGGSGGGTPAGSGTELQYRSSASAFGAVTGSSVSAGTIIASGLQTAASGTYTNMSTSGLTFSNGTTGDLNTIRFTDTIGPIWHDDNGGGNAQWSIASVTGTKTFTLPNTTGNVVVDGATQTLTAKTLTTPTLTGERMAVAAKTANYTVTTADSIVTGDATGGTFTLTLPAASSAFSSNAGSCFRFKKLDSSGNAVTIARAGSDTIDGATSVSLSSQYQSKDVCAITSSSWGVF